MSLHKSTDLTEEELTTEVWKDIPEWEGFYQASSLGRIRSLHRYDKDSLGRTKNKKGRVRVVKEKTNSYLGLTLTTSNKRKSCSVHKLVCSTFHPNTENKCCVNHKDSNKQNNRANNLEWCTIRENVKHWIENDASQSSNYIGVSIVRSYNKWRSAIELNGVVYSLGTYESELKAYTAYTDALSEWEQNGTVPNYRDTNLSSKYKGIYKKQGATKWTSCFIIEGKNYFIGNFETEELAKEAQEKELEKYNKTGIFPKKQYTSKYLYLSWKEPLSKWQVAIPVEKGKRKYIGVYSCEEEACRVVMELLNLTEKPVK